MTTWVFRGKICMTPLHNPGPKKGVNENSVQLFFYGCRVIVNFVPKFVAMATGVGRGEI